MRIPPHFGRIVPLLALGAALFGSAGVAQSSEDPPRILERGPGWRYFDTTPTATGGEVWEVYPGAVNALPVSETQRQIMQDAFDSATTDLDLPIYFDQEGLAQAEANQASGSAVAELSLCGWNDDEKKIVRDWSKDIIDEERQWSAGNGALQGTFRLTLPLTGHVEGGVRYSYRACPRPGFKIKSFWTKGSVSMNGEGSLAVTATARQTYEKQWKIAEPELGEVWWGPVRFVFTLPIFMGVKLDAAVSGEVGMELNATASGTFDYYCPWRKSCTGTTNFTDNFEITGPQGSAELDLTAEGNAMALLRASVWHSSIGYAQAGAQAYARAKIWGYYGDTCGDADGNGSNETVEALVAELRAGYQFAYGWDTFLTDSHFAYTGGQEWLLAWRDLLGDGGSTALQPMILGPATVVAGSPAQYTVNMRPCYPYTESVTFTMSPGTWTGGNSVTPGAGGTVVGTTFATPGGTAVTARATRDTAGRDINVPYTRTVNVVSATPTAPSGLTGVVSGHTTVTLNWTDNSVNETEFQVQRRVPGQGSFADVLVAPANATSVTDSGLSAWTTYEYRVRAINGSFASSYSNVASVSTTGTIPPAPVGLSATTTSSTSIRLDWTDNSSGETFFRAQRRLAPSGGWESFHTTGPNATTLTATGLQPNTAYDFRILAGNANGTSPYSNVASATTTNAVPNPPSGLAAGALSPTSVRVTWADNSTNETGFELQRRPAGGVFATLVNLGANATSYTDNTVSPLTSYEYRVRASNGLGASPFAGPTAVTTPPISGYQGCFTDAATRALPAQLGGTTHTVESCKQAGYNAGYRYAGVQWYGYCFGGNTLAYVQVADAECNTPCSSNPQQMCGGGWRNSIYATGYVPQPPAGPTGLAATVLSDTSVRLSWIDNSQNETQFNVQRRSYPSGTFAIVGVVGTNVTTWTDAGLAPNTSYEYKVRAIGDAGGSTFSNTVIATTQSGIPAAPSNLTAIAVSSSTVAVSWIDNSGNETQFNVQRRNYPYGAFAIVAVVGANVTSWTDSGVAPSTSYEYKVRAIGSAGSSPFSNTSLVTTPAPPSASIAWIQPAESSWGPAGTLTAAGYASNGSGGVQLVWRERLNGVWSGWNVVAWQPPPGADTTWSNTISSGNPTNKCNWFDAYVNYSGISSAVYNYRGAPGCP
jgi:fibronectin type 3 domain-containing protein